MFRVQQAAVAVGVIALTALFVWGGCGLTKHVIVAVDKWGDSAPKPVVDALVRPCAPGPCGTLATVNKAVTKIGDAVVTTQIQERKAAPHVIVAMDTLNDSAAKLGWTADALTRTGNAATESAAALTTSLQTANETIGAAQAPLRAFNRDAEDLDALLKRQAIGQILDHAAGITQHADAITGDLQAVSDKATKDYLTPKPFWRKFGQYAGDTFDVGAFLARHY